MKVAIHQPQYFPWPPYVHKVMSADIFVYLDTAQFSKNGVQNRNQIKTAQGALWLTLPVKHELGRSIRETAIADRKATEKHWKTLQANYARTAGFARWQEELRDLLQIETRSLAELAIATTEWMIEKCNVRARRIRASGIEGASGQGSSLVASICQELGATEYLSGPGALAYMNQDNFRDIGCEVWMQNWKPFTYEQAQPSMAFVTDLSTLDLLLNCPDSAAEMIHTAGSWQKFSCQTTE